jgi:nitroreductase
MDFQEVIRRRHMVRTFTDVPVPRASIERILKNAVRGPSAGFCQGQAFVVLSGAQLRAFWAIAGEAAVPSVRTAPLIIIPLSCKRMYIDQYVQNADEGEDWTDESTWWPVPFWHIDTGMAALLILLTVVDERLGACYFGIMPHEYGPLRVTFGIPADYEPIGAVAVGYSAESHQADYSSHRRPPGEMVHYEHW